MTILFSIVYSQVGGKQPICCMSDVDKSGFDNTYIKKLSKDIESIVTNTEGLMNTEDSKLVNIDIKSDVQNFKYHYKLFYMTLQNVICFAIVDENQDLKQVYSFCYTVLNEMYKGITSSKNSSILYNNIPFQLINLQPMMDKLAVKTPTVNNSNSSSLEALNSELKDITSILNSNIEKLIVRGESLQNLNDLSDSLKHNSLKYKKNIKMYNLKLLMSEYAPIAFVSLIFVFLIWYIMLRK
jgi:vesicle transport protein SEC22